MSEVRKYRKFRQREPLRVPSTWKSEDRAFAIQLNGQLDEIYANLGSIQKSLFVIGITNDAIVFPEDHQIYIGDDVLDKYLNTHIFRGAGNMTAIPKNADLNNLIYRVGGVYSIDSGTTAQTLLHIPSEINANTIMITIHNTGTEGTANSYGRQILMTYNPANKMYIRSFHGGNVYSSWYALEGTAAEERTT